MPPETPEQTRWFAEEVQPHERSLRAYLHGTAPLLADVDDLVQESYLRLLRMRETGQIRSVKAALFAIARNAVRDALRRKMINREVSVTEIDALPVSDETADPLDALSRQQEQRLLAEAIKALPERCREVLLLRKIHGVSQREIALRLGISENTVESLVSRGVRRCGKYLRKRMEKEK